MQRPFGLHGRIRFARADAHSPVDASIALGGDLATPSLAMRATVGKTVIDGGATRRPFDTSWLATLSLTAGPSDLAEFDAAWPRPQLRPRANGATASARTASSGV